MAKFLNILSSLLIIGFFLFVFVVIGSIVIGMNVQEIKVSKDSVLLLDLEGMIVDGEKFLEKLRKYREQDHIKAVVVQVNSPGGVVGPSQEIYSEIIRTREEYKKPVVFSCLGLAASGAYYAAAGADKFVVNPGCMVGSIGVIMQFANLEKLLSWAKIERYALKTGAFKDTGAEYRPMGAEERAMLEELLFSVLGQFKKAIIDGRKMKAQVVEENADGRIFTGEMAVRMGFADQLGTLDDAIRIAGELGGIRGKPEIFKPRARRSDEFWEMLSENAEGKMPLKWLESVAPLKLSGQPLFVWSGALGL